jgi:hypothetical protein
MKQEKLITIETLTDRQARNRTQAFATDIQVKRASEYRFTNQGIFEYASITNDWRWLHRDSEETANVSCKALFDIS